MRSRLLNPTWMAKNTTNTELKFYVDAPDFVPSLNPADSDIVRNAVVMEQLVGTLLKERFANTGRTEPYLAESWSSDDLQLNWQFHFRQGLRCQDGTPINAYTFEKSLKKRLKLLSSEHDLPAFNRLLGWEKFRNGSTSSLDGLKAESINVLSMHFTSRPEGLTEYLAMVNFGFYSDSDYENDHWKDNQFINSSGAYQVLEFNGNKLTLTKRIDWPLNTNPRSPKLIKYFFTDSQSAIKNLDEVSIFPLRRAPDDFSIPPNLKVVKGSPIFLTALVLSPDRNAFANPEVRRNFSKKISELKLKVPYSSEYAFLTESFYPSNQKSFRHQPQEQKYNGEIKIGFDPKLNAKDIKYSIELATEAAKELGFNVALSPFDHNDPSWVSRRISNKYYDIRIASVDIGAAPENWLIQMMFCSKIGVGFPDPSDQICQFSKKIESSEIKLSTDDYTKKFENFVYQDAAVIPMLHSGYIWLFGSAINPQSFSPTSVVPRAELMSINE